MTKPQTLNFDVLHNFISPVTGRILCTTDYVLLGDSNGIAVPSPILIPILPIVPLIPMLESLPLTDFVIGHPNSYLPVAQVLSTMSPDTGFVYSTAGVVSIKDEIPIDNLPGLGYHNYWEGDITGRPVEDTTLYNDMYGTLGIGGVYGAGGLAAQLFIIETIALPDITGDIDDIQNILEATVDNTILLGTAGGDAVWSSATYPSTVNANDLIYASANDIISTLPSVINSVLTTDGTGVPMWVTLSAFGVNSVTGTPGQIVISGLSTDPVIGIDPTYVGQASITTLGTITLGIWNANIIDLAYGGTNANLIPSNGGIVYSTATELAILSGTPTAHKVLLSQSTSAPIWSSATYPDATTINQLLYSINNNDIAGLSSIPNSVLTTDSGGVPSWTPGGTIVSITGTAGQIVITGTLSAPIIGIDPTYVGQSSITTVGTITTGTWNGTIINLAHGGTNANLTASNGGIVYSTSTALSILNATATANQVLLSGANSAPSWSTATYLSSTTANRLLYSSANNVVNEIPTANNSILTTNGSGVPSWSTFSSSAVTSITGTVDEINVSSPTGAVTISLPNDVYVSGSVGAGFMQMGGGTLETVNPNGSMVIRPNGAGDLIFLTGATTGFVGVDNPSPNYLLDVNGTTRVERLIGSGTTPTVTLGATTVVGTGATSSISGREVVGRFTLNTGTGILLTAGVAATFTLSSAMPQSNFYVNFFPATNVQSAIYGTSTSSTTFTLNIRTALVLAASTTYIWNYQIIGYD